MGKPAVVTSETREISDSYNETNFKFVIAMTVLVVFFIVLLVPIALGKDTLFKDAAAIMTGFVGTILGYYFGSKKETPTE